MKFGNIVKLLVLVAALGNSVAIACGHCVEDRIAAVYDHALLQRTLASKHEIAFFVWDGPLPHGDAERRKIVALVEATPVVDKGSTRVSMEPAALAVAFDPRRSSIENLQAALQKSLAKLKLSLTLLQAPKAR